MSLTGWIYVTAAVTMLLLVAIVMVTRRVIRTVPGAGVDARAIAELVAELRRSNDLAERRVVALEERVARLEQGADTAPSNRG